MGPLDKALRLVLKMNTRFTNAMQMQEDKKA